jgi:hypothetical protein
VQSVDANITSRTKVVMAIHYAGNPFDIDVLVQLCKSKSIYLIEDAAQCMGSTFNNKPLGSFGHRLPQFRLYEKCFVWSWGASHSERSNAFTKGANHI